MDTHRRLEVWQHARRLVRLVYRLTDGLPANERFIAVAQMRRAAWSVHNNIAEGNARLGRAEMRRFFGIAIGSLAEIDAMMVTLGDLYTLESSVVSSIMDLRHSINGKLFAMLRAPSRPPAAGRPVRRHP